MMIVARIACALLCYCLFDLGVTVKLYGYVNSVLLFCLGLEVTRIQKQSHRGHAIQTAVSVAILNLFVVL